LHNKKSQMTMNAWMKTEVKANEQHY